MAVFSGREREGERREREGGREKERERGEEVGEEVRVKIERHKRERERERVRETKTTNKQLPIVSCYKLHYTVCSSVNYNHVVCGASLPLLPVWSHSLRGESKGQKTLYTPSFFHGANIYFLS